MLQLFHEGLINEDESTTVLVLKNNQEVVPSF